MPNYNNPKTKLTAPTYKWEVTFALKPVKPGNNRAHDYKGSYDTQPGATVGSLLTGIQRHYASSFGVSPDALVMLRYSVREK